MHTLSSIENTIPQNPRVYHAPEAWFQLGVPIIGNLENVPPHLWAEVLEALIAIANDQEEDGDDWSMDANFEHIDVEATDEEATDEEATEDEAGDVEEVASPEVNEPYDSSDYIDILSNFDV